MTDQTKSPDPLDTREEPEAPGSAAGKTAKPKPKSVLLGRTKTSLEGEDPAYTVSTYLVKTGNPDILGGFLVINGQKHEVLCHINEKANGAEHTDPATGEVSKEKYLTFTTETAAEGEPSKRKVIAHGNAVNHRNDGKPVDFGTMLINPVGEGHKPLRATVTKECDPELHKRLGFTHERVVLPRENTERTAQAPAQQEPEAPAKASRSRQAAAPKAKEDPLAPEASQPAPTRQRKARAPERVADAGPTR